jgi:predicted CoA-binding protein
MSRPLANKLYIREGYRIAILNPPVGYSQLLGELPENVTVANSLEGEFDVIQFFVTKRKKLEEKLSGLSNALRSRGLVWVTYPKGNQSDADINRDSIVAYAKTIGLKAVAQVSVDDSWSALRFKVVG